MKTINTLSYLILILALLGFIDATYLAMKYFAGEAVICGLIEGCEKVLSSDYSSIFGIQLSLIGVIYYALISSLAFLFSINKNHTILKIFFSITLIGFLASIYFVYIQLFMLNAICIYCMTSASITTILFLLSIFLIRITKQKEQSI